MVISSDRQHAGDSRWRFGILIGLAVAAVVAVFRHAPIPQDPAYHAFADGRSLMQIPNFWNVVSNLPFLAIGILGLMAVRTARHAPGISSLLPAYVTFFASTIAVAFGSAYYHLAPDNRTLTWDRLPMTVTFMAFLGIMISERIDTVAGRQLLPIFNLIGAGSVMYWHMTEAAGRGDLRPYVLVQFLPMLLLPAVLLLFPGPNPPTSLLGIMLALYVVAKLAELGDAVIYDVTQIVSGHTLKHLLGAAAAGCLVFALRRRRGVMACALIVLVSLSPKTTSALEALR